jgi:hypothetical protein
MFDGARPSPHGRIVDYGAAGPSDATALQRRLAELNASHSLRHAMTFFSPPRCDGLVFGKTTDSVAQ